MFLGHTSGDHAYLKQGKDYVPIPVEDAVVVSMGFSEGEVAPLELAEQMGTDVGLAQSPYEDMIENFLVPDETVAADVGLATCPYELTIVTDTLPTEMTTVDVGLIQSPYVTAIISTNLADAVGFTLNFGNGVYRDSIEATPLLSESVGYGINFGGGAHV